jgi:hypothetical protein
MTIGIRGYSNFLLLTGVLALVPLQISSSGVSYDQALSKAGGQGKGNGQGSAHAGSNGGGPGRSGGSVASPEGLAKGQNYNVDGRLNALVKASSTAWNNPNSQIGKIAQTLTAAFGDYLQTVSTTPAGTAVPLPTDLVSILTTVSNKELTQEDLDAIEARIAQENPDNALFQSLVAPNPETTDLQSQTFLQSVDETLINAVNALEEPNQGPGKLGPIY